jgi:hypothetical protein
MKIKLDREHLDKVIAKALRKDAKELESQMPMTNVVDRQYFNEMAKLMRKVAKHYEP